MSDLLASFLAALAITAAALAAGGALLETTGQQPTTAPATVHGIRG